MREAGAHFRAGRLSEAEAICLRLIHAEPRLAPALHLLARIRKQCGRAQESVEFLARAVIAAPDIAAIHYDLGEAQQLAGDLSGACVSYSNAIAIDPRLAEAHNNLGFAFALQQRDVQAEESFRTAARLKPLWGVPRFNLGLVLKKRGLFEAAAAEFRAAWLADPALDSSIVEMVNVLAESVRLSPQPCYVLEGSTNSTASASYSVIFCSVDASKRERAKAMYQRLLAGRCYEIIAVEDAKSLAEAYNRAIAASTGENVILSHDDIEILATNFASRIEAHLAAFDAIGVMGGTEMSGPAWCWSRHPHLRGWITHRSPTDEVWEVSVVDPRPVAGPVAVLDGVFVAARRAVFATVTFDELTFDGFHLYDMDWSVRTTRAGFRIGVAGDLLVVHESRGNYDKRWAVYAERFCDKYELRDLPPPPPAQLVCASLNSREEVRSFFHKLGNLSS
jgi:Tfp pilus assembly protein PilF